MTGAGDDEEGLLRSVALQTTQSVLVARQRADQALREANEALAHSVATLRATLEATTDGILVSDGVHRITGYNQRFIDMWRVPRELVEAGDRHALLAFTSRQIPDPDAYVAGIERIHRESPTESFDLLELADGRIYERFSRIQFVEGTRLGRVWSFRDITERRRAEQALLEETRVLELLNRTGMMLAANLDPESTLQAVTDAATQMSGARFGAFFYNVRDASGDAYMLYTLSGAPREAFAKFSNPRATALFGPTFRGAPPIRCDDITRDPRYGKSPPHHGMPPGHLPVRSYLAVPVMARSGEVMGGLFFGHPDVGVFTERSERLVVGVAAQAGIAVENARLLERARQAAEERERLLESERAARSEAERLSSTKDSFLATLSHELRTPLSAILGWSQVLRLRSGDPADLQEGLRTIERNARVQIQLIEDLLDMSRITSGKLRLDTQALEPATFVEAAIATVVPAAEAKGVRVEKVLDPACGPVFGDPSRLQQVVWNLLANAVKFTPKGGKVQVRLARAESDVAISIADTGMGIAADFLPHVFERFSQADGSTTRRFGGLGLGLSIVRQLVELHGGSVSVQSPGENQGATFSVHLPLMVLHDRGQQTGRVGERPPPVADFTQSDLTGVKVLVVDDEPDARELIRRVLAECGAEVHVAADAEAAVAVVEREHPQVFISDIGMPGVDGYRLLKRVRDLGARAGGDVHAIALTAFARPEDRTRALQAGFLVHVAKPVEPAELAATVASVVGRAGARTN